jgi:hypothetical protein
MLWVLAGLAMIPVLGMGLLVCTLGVLRFAVLGRRR